MTYLNVLKKKLKKTTNTDFSRCGKLCGAELT